MEVLDRMPWAAKNSVFQRLAKIAEVRNLTKEERMQYDASLKRYRDTLNVMRGAVEEGKDRVYSRDCSRAYRKAELKRGMP